MSPGLRHLELSRGSAGVGGDKNLSLPHSGRHISLARTLGGSGGGSRRSWNGDVSQAGLPPADRALRPFAAFHWPRQPQAPPTLRPTEVTLRKDSWAGEGATD